MRYKAVFFAYSFVFLQLLSSLYVYTCGYLIYKLNISFSFFFLMATGKSYFWQWYWYGCPFLFSINIGKKKMVFEYRGIRIDCSQRLQKNVGLMSLFTKLSSKWEISYVLIIGMECPGDWPYMNFGYNKRVINRYKS